VTSKKRRGRNAVASIKHNEFLGLRYPYAVPAYIPMQQE
jgi:hypothetical protein